MPSVASTIEVPASAPGGQTSGEGGEWELLLEKLLLELLGLGLWAGPWRQDQMPWQSGKLRICSRHVQPRYLLRTLR